MLTEILAELKKQNPELECWTEGLKEESFDNNTLTISVPNPYFVEKYETECKDKIAEIASKKLGRKIYVQLQLPSESEIIQSQKVEAKPKPKPKPKPKKFNGNPNFKDKAEVEEYVGYAKTKKRKNKTSTIISIAENNPMPNPYSVENVACFTGLIGQFFTMPNDRRKSAKVKIKVRCQNGDIKEYELYRGQRKFKDEGTGQLNTSHAKLLLAVVHMWQKQGCRFKDEEEGLITGVRLSIRDLAKTLGFKKFGGATLRWIVKRLDELRTRYNLLSDGKRGIGFTLIDGIWYSDIKKQSDKLTVDVVFNPYISKQLYDRKAFYRKPECYKIQNPTAIKFLLNYDRAIYTGNVITKTIAEVAEDLQLENTGYSNILRGVRGAVKELNGYELNSEYNLKMVMVRGRNRYIVRAERIRKSKAMVSISHIVKGIMV